MRLNLGSKTHQGLVLVLVVAVGMAWFGKLSAELADVLKYVGGGFMGVRSISNLAEAFTQKDK